MLHARRRRRAAARGDGTLPEIEAARPGRQAGWPTVLLIAAIGAGALSWGAQGAEGGWERCVSTAETCKAECRARNFAADPRRAACLTTCVEAGSLCIWAAGPSQTGTGAAAGAARSPAPAGGLVGASPARR